jgi:predicted TIM-barrel fold metal-dependent hydrolase
MGLWGPHVKEVVEVFGADRVFFGTDYGPVPIDPSEHIAIVEELDISAEDKEKIYWKNANEFFNLGLSA